MALGSAVGQFQKVSSGVSSTQTITTSFQVKALILYSVNATAQNVFQDSYQFVYGFSDQTNHRSVCIRATDAKASPFVADTSWQNAIVHFIDATPTVTSSATVSFGASTGFTLTWTTNDTTTPFIHYIAYGGSDITNVKVGNFNAPAAVAQQDITDPGFMPDMCFFLTPTSRVTDTGTAVDAAMGIGFAHAAGQTGAWSVATDDTVSVTGTAKIQVADRVITGVDPNDASNFTDVSASFVTWISTGFRLNWTKVLSGNRNFYMAIKGGYWQVGNIQGPPSGTPPINTTTTVGWQPDGIMLSGIGDDALQTAETGVTISKISVGAASSTSNRSSVFAGDNTGITTSVSAVHDDNDLLMHHATPTATATSSTDLQRADLNAFTSTGFTISYAIAAATADLFSFYVVWASEPTPTAHNIKTGRFQALPTTARHSISVRDLGFRPKALIVWSVGAATDNAFTDGYTPAIGFSDGTNERCVSAINEDAAATMNAATQYYDSIIVNLSFAVPTISDRGNALFFADGFDIDFVVAGTLARYYSYIALGGTNITNVKVGQFTHSNTTGNQSSTDAGFSPDLVLFLPTRAATNQTGQAHSTIGLGAMERSGTQMSLFNTSTDNVANSTSSRTYETAHCIVNLAPGAASGSAATVDSKASFVSMDTNGWTINWSDAHPNATDLIFYMAIRGGRYHCNTVGTPVGGTAVPNTVNYPQAGFLPKGVMFASISTSLAVGTIAVSGVMTLGAVTNPAVAAEQNAAATLDIDGQTSALTARRTEQAACLINNNVAATASTSAMWLRADVSAFNLTGFNLRTTLLNASELMRTHSYIAFGERALVTYPITINETGISLADTLTEKFKARRTIATQTVVIGASTIVRKVKVKGMTVQTVVIGASTIARKVKVKGMTVQTVVIGASTILTRQRRPITETGISLAETLTRRLSAKRTMSETAISLVETLRRVKVKRRVTETTISLAGTLTRRLSAKRTMSETAISLAATLLEKLSARRTVSETGISFGDTLTERLSAKRTISESGISLTETLQRLKVKRRMSESTISLADVLTRRFFARRTIAEGAISSLDSITIKRRRRLAIAEPATVIGDSISKRLSAFRTTTEPGQSIADTLTSVIQRVRTITDGAISLAEVIRLKTKRIVEDLVTVADIAAVTPPTGHKSFFRTISEPVETVDDTLTSALKQVRTIIEGTIAVLDSITRKIVVRLTTIEPAVTIADTITIAVAYLKTITEGAISTSDSLLLRVRLKITETAQSMVDLIALRVRLLVTINESAVSLSATLARKYYSLRTILESPVPITDAVNVIGHRVISDILIVSDSITRRLRFIINELGITIVDNIPAGRLQSRRIIDETSPASDIISKRLSAFRTIDEIGETVSDYLLTTFAYFASITEPAIEIADNIPIIRVFKGIFKKGRRFFRHLGFGSTSLRRG